MEATIYEQICARLTDATVKTWITGKGFTPPVDIKWFEDQVTQLLAEDASQEKAPPLAYPAVLVEFEASEFDEGSNPNRPQGTGKLVLHIVQQQTAKDGAEGAATHTDFKNLVKYKDLFIDLLNAFTLPCSARLVLAGSQPDHLNRPLRDDTVTFSWKGTRQRSTGVP